MNGSPIGKSTIYPSRVGSPVTPSLADHPPKDAALNLLCLAAQSNNNNNIIMNQSFHPSQSQHPSPNVSSTQSHIISNLPQQHLSTQSTSPISIQPFNTPLPQSIHHANQSPFPLYMTQPSTSVYSSTSPNPSPTPIQYVSYPSIPNTCTPNMGVGMNIPIGNGMIYDPYNNTQTSTDPKQNISMMSLGMNMGIGIGIIHPQQQQQQQQQPHHHHQSIQQHQNPIRKVKGPWRPEEDKILTELVSKFGPRRWTVIASHITGRTGKQARERWLNQLSPDLTKRPWTVEEDRIVMQAHARLGNRWSEIAKLLKGRTDNATKNRFNTTIRRQISELSSAARAQLSNCSVEKSTSSPATSGDELEHKKQDNNNKCGKKRKLESSSTENESLPQRSKTITT